MDELKKLFENAISELEEIQFCDNTWKEAVIEKQMTREIFHKLLKEVVEYLEIRKL